jgi:hypothetical protein
MPEPITVQVHPIALVTGDLLLQDPDDPQREANWRITAPARREGTVIVADYVTGDGTVGCHGFEDESVWLEVVPPFEAPPMPQPRTDPDPGQGAEADDAGDTEDAAEVPA